MKNIRITFGIIFISLLAGCASDGSSDGNRTLDGRWVILHIGENGAGVYQYEGQLAWVFDADSHTVTVTNMNTNEEYTDIFETGTYDYTISNESIYDDCSRNIMINGLNLGCYDIGTETENGDQYMTMTSEDYVIDFYRE